MSERDRERPAGPGFDSSATEQATAGQSVVDSLVARVGPAGAQRAIQRRIAQRKARIEQESAAQVHPAAEKGTSGAGGPLPHLDAIQKSFGKHDVSHVKAHTDGAAAEGAAAMGAEAFATGDRVAFARAPSLHTAAHEAAHVVQQRGGVQLKGGVGQVGDQYEQHADAVADRVVRGESAETLLDGMAHAGGANGSGAAVQRVLEVGDAGARMTASHLDNPNAFKLAAGPKVAMALKRELTDAEWLSVFQCLRQLVEAEPPHFRFAKTSDAIVRIATDGFSVAGILADPRCRVGSAEAAAGHEDGSDSETAANMGGTHAYDNSAWKNKQKGQEKSAKEAATTSSSSSSGSEFDLSTTKPLGNIAGVDVWIDSHQDKHQTTVIFGPWKSKSGSKFKAGKDLTWHAKNTAPVIAAIALQAQKDGWVKEGDRKAFYPKKVAQSDGIIYDAAITLKNGKLTVVYHCNPTESE